MDIAALIVAGSALVVSVVAAIYTRSQARSTRELANIEADRRGDEVAVRDERRARDAAAMLHIQPVDPGGDGVVRELRISNPGNHAASHLRFEAESLDEHRVSSRLLDGFARIDEFMRNGEYRMGTYPHTDAAKVIRLTVRWTDGRPGEQQEVWERLPVG